LKRGETGKNAAHPRVRAAPGKNRSALMAEWSKRRFWSHAGISRRNGRYIISLDAENLKTPAQSVVALPTRASAALVAREWDELDGVIRLEEMPNTRLAFTAIDKVAPSRKHVAAEVAEYGETDLICYRSESPPELAERQEAAWNPLLAWCDNEFGAKLRKTRGVYFLEQPASGLARLRRAVAEFGEFELAAFSELVTLTGSLVLGLAAERGFISPDEAWRASRIDEDWQFERWGDDAEALEVAESRRRSLVAAHEFLEAIRSGD